MTVLLSQAQIQKVLDIKLALQTVERAFKAHAVGKAEMPPKVYLQFPKGDLRCMPAYMHDGDMDVAGIKSVNVHPNNRDVKNCKIGPKTFKGPFHTVMATISLTDPKTGFNFAVLDGTYITSMRTGAAGGIAAKYLARKNAKVAGFIGAGNQARTQLQALMQVRKLKEIRVYSRTFASSVEYCSWAKRTFKIKATPVKTPKEACENVDIITTVTPSTKPIVKEKWVREGTHINGIGADAPGKQEIETSLTKKCKVVIDQWDQASHSGEINVPLHQKKISKKHIYAELGKIVAGKKKGRTNDKEITLFDSTGLAIQDISTAYVVYKKLAKNGKVFKFF